MIKDETLLILSRYNHNKLTEGNLKSIKDQWDGGTISQRSIHSSKGLEADFVIVSDLKSDFFGFPSEILDDPILNLVYQKKITSKIARRGDYSMWHSQEQNIKLT